AFELYVRWSGLADKLQAGTYRVPAGLTEVQLIQLLERNTGGTSVTLTVPEGWTPGQIGRAAESKGLFSAAAYLDVVQHGTFSDAFLAGRPAGADLTGYLFPDTYYLAPDAKPADLVQLQLRRFGEVVTPELRARAQVHGLTFHQALTMASIIEREAAFAEDRAPIAQVFYNRLAAGMPLQDDATLLFAKGVTSGIPTDADKQVNSPYNTYLHTGLPPGPICNPGLAAIQAALNPTPNDYLYFITDNAGHAHFARTLAEHEALIARYGVH
ncbi:MAG TPA: endolytic transglycosylase MltG, partial [Candidatus Dormibacteraeota bacterium]|nr:endolytic transglycosylase MltG [Candidatus Dormibacteraeota bacterium]